MPIVTAIATYFILWWLLLFTVLPWGIHGQHENDDVTPGTEPGAPQKPLMLRKIIQTSVLAAVVWMIIYIIITFNLIDVDKIPFIPDFVPKDY
jgi:predicted secreted protein